MALLRKLWVPMSKHEIVEYDILGVRVSAITIDQSLEVVQSWVAMPGKRSRIIIKPYVEFLTAAQRDIEITGLLNHADLSLADGVSLQWAASYLYGMPNTKPSLLKLVRSLLSWIQKPAWRNQILPERFAGISHTKPLLDMAQKLSWRVGVIGGNDPARTSRALMKRWPDLKLAGTWSGYTMTTQSADYSSWHSDAAFDEIVKNIRKASVDVLLVGMGFPRQEHFMHAMQAEGLATVMIGEGGSFDFEELGGSKKRAPQAWRKLGLEWLWRLILEPRRILRQLAIPRFVWAVQGEAKRRYRAHNQEKS